MRPPRVVFPDCTPECIYSAVHVLQITSEILPNYPGTLQRIDLKSCYETLALVHFSKNIFSETSQPFPG